MTEENRQTFLYFVDELFNKGNPTVIDEVVTPDFILHDPAVAVEPVLDGYKRLIGQLDSAFTDTKMVIEDAIAKDDKVVTRWLWTGTHSGVFRGIPASGKRVRATGMSIARFENCRLVEGWNEWDGLGLMQQLGSVPESEQLEANKTIIRRWYEEVVNRLDTTLIDQFCHLEMVSHSPSGDQHGIEEGPKAAFDLFKRSFPDLHITIDDMIAEGDKVAVRWTATGTHTGPFLEIEPTQERISLSALYIYRLAEGKIAEVWLIRDELGMLKQLGAVPE